MSIHAKMFLVSSLPGAFCMTFWYLAWIEGNTPDGHWLFVLGAMSAVTAITLGRCTWLTDGQRRLEERNAELARKLRDVEEDLRTVREDVNSRLATKAWRDAGFRSAVRSGNRQLFSIVEQLDGTQQHES